MGGLILGIFHISLIYITKDRGTSLGVKKWDGRGMGSRFDLWQWDINEGITGKGAVSGFGYDINIG